MRNWPRSKVPRVTALCVHEELSHLKGDTPLIVLLPDALAAKVRTYQGISQFHMFKRLLVRAAEKLAGIHARDVELAPDTDTRVFLGDLQDL